MSRTITWLTGLLVLLLVFVGCQAERSPVEPLVTEPTPALAKIELPMGATVESAILYVQEINGTGEPTYIVNAYPITAPWDESLVTWNSFGGAYDGATLLGSFPTQLAGEKSIDITSLVQQWVAGTYDNNGVLLKLDMPYPYAEFLSSEYADILLRPRLEIRYTVGGSTNTVVIQRGTLGEVADAYVWARNPDDNYNNERLITGFEEEYEKYALLRFDVTVAPSGCTRTPGYWMTHSDRGPAPYDHTWKMLGVLEEDTPFFLSGKTYYQALWMNSRKGNAYYILAQAYIAAQLNTLGGVSIPGPVSTAWDQATILFNTYTPLQVAAWKGSKGQRSTFLALAKILDDYNNGLIGPGHCPD